MELPLEYVDPGIKQGFDSSRIRCGGLLGGLLILGSVGCAVPLLFVPVWVDVPSEELLHWKPLPGRPSPAVTATLFFFDFEKPEWTGKIEKVPGFYWMDFCSFEGNETQPVAAKLIEGTIFSPTPLEADPTTCLGATAACGLTVIGVLSIAAADLFILLAAAAQSILLLLFGGFLALLSALALLLALGGLFLVDAKHLGTGPGVICLSGSVVAAFVGTLMTLYQAMKATPDRLPTRRPRWKEPDEELTEEQEKQRIQQALVECLDYDIPRLERYRVSKHILKECEVQDLSYEEWVIEERMRMKIGKSRRAVLTEEELKRATVELRIRRLPHDALKQALHIMLMEAKKGRRAHRVPAKLLSQAFQDIDVTLRNTITVRELLAALKACGIYLEGPALEKLLAWLQRQDDALIEEGKIDLPKFLLLFNNVTDMLAKEYIMQKSSRGYKLMCRLSFLMNLVFICIILYSVTREAADNAWRSLLNVFGFMFAVQCSVVILFPMLCSVLGRKAKVWRQHFCAQLAILMEPVLRLLLLCYSVLVLTWQFITGCCGLCELCQHCCSRHEESEEEFEEEAQQDEMDEYALGEDMDLGSPSEDESLDTEAHNDTAIQSESESIDTEAAEQMHKYDVERKKVRTPTEGTLRQAGLAFKSEDEVFSYQVFSKRRKKSKQKEDRDRNLPEIQELPEAWGANSKKKRRPSRRASAGRRSSGGFFGSLLGSKEELAVVKEMSGQSNVSHTSRRSSRVSQSELTPRSGSSGTPRSTPRGRSNRVKRSTSLRSFWSRRSSQSRTSEETGYEPRGYALAQLRARAPHAAPSSFSPMQVRDLAAPELLPPPPKLFLQGFQGSFDSTTASKSFSASQSYSKASAGSQEDWLVRNITKDTKEMYSEEMV